MHHNEGIQANTEFEYLRNILFQVSRHTNKGVQNIQHILSINIFYSIFRVM